MERIKMILVINICKEKLHYYEFVKPVCDILKQNKIKFFVRDYKEITGQDLNACSKIIICGTSLYDNEFLLDVNRFGWALELPKPILGICGGMQILGLIFGGKLRRKTEIGFFEENFKREFLGLHGCQKAYHLHNNWVSFGRDFEEFSDSKINQAVKHRKKDIYGVLFHPEVGQKDLIRNFGLNL